MSAYDIALAADKRKLPAIHMLTLVTGKLADLMVYFSSYYEGNKRRDTHKNEEKCPLSSLDLRPSLTQPLFKRPFSYIKL